MLSKTRHGLWRMSVSSLLTMAILIGFTVAVSEPSLAYNLAGPGCRYDPANDSDGLGIGFNSTNFNLSRRNSTEDAAARWNARVAPQFTLVSYGSSTRDLRVDFSFLGAGGPAAEVILWCHPANNHYSQDPRFNWNLDYTHPAPTDTLQTVTAIHELGHSYGLDHNQTAGCNSNTAGLMFAPSSVKYNACSWLLPSNDDVLGQIDAHNG